MAISFFRARRPPLVIAHRGQTAVVSFTTTELQDEAVIRSVERQLASLLSHPECRHFILNLGAVKVMASLMLAKLVGFQKQVKAAGADLTLCAVGPELYGVFEWTQLGTLFHIERNGA